MMMWNPPGAGWWGYAGMGIGMVLFWGLLVVAVVLLVRSTGDGRHPPPPSTHAAPERVLADRFARGEIDEQEYRERIAVLRTQPQA